MQWKTVQMICLQLIRFPLKTTTPYIAVDRSDDDRSYVRLDDWNRDGQEGKREKKMEDAIR